MNSTPRRTLLARSIASLGLVAATLLSQAHAAKSHALILWIGDYGRADLNLPGIDTDARLARQMAMKMGVKADDIREVSNRGLNVDGFVRAFSDLEGRVGQGDQVFIYFSGHGYQEGAGSQCRESLVGYGPSFFSDEQMKSTLERLGQKARQVIMMNDSCFSGGAASSKQANLTP
ncbi:MAG: caspase family protein, partial [Hydrogenophaga sp.]|nr:caspase family protein [Hydrogenophaga sp.]